MKLVALLISIIPVVALGADAGAEKTWALAKVTLKSGAAVVVNYRTAAPPGVTRAEYPSRASIRCSYLDRGDTSGLPEKDVLKSLQELELTVESANALRMMSKTGELARESIFQVKNAPEFIKVVREKAKVLSLECSTTLEKDAEWNLWNSTAERFQNQSRPAAKTQ